MTGENIAPVGYLDDGDIELALERVAGLVGGKFVTLGEVEVDTFSSDDFTAPDDSSNQSL